MESRRVVLAESVPGAICRVALRPGCNFTSLERGNPVHALFAAAPRPFHGHRLRRQR